RNQTDGESMPVGRHWIEQGLGADARHELDGDDRGRIDHADKECAQAWRGWRKDGLEPEAGHGRLVAAHGLTPGAVRWMLDGRGTAPCAGAAGATRQRAISGGGIAAPEAHAYSGLKRPNRRSRR